MSKEQEELQFWHLRIFYFRIIRELLKQPANKKCFDCPTKGPVYVNLFNDTFVCAKCSGIHREFNHRVKSILASTFTPAEIESLKNGGNAWVDFPEPDPSDIESIRTLMSMKYKQKKWLDESLLKANNKRPPNGEDYVVKKFPPQKSDNDDDIFSDFQTAPDVNSQKKMCSTNLNSYKNHTFSNGSTNTNMNSSQQKQFGHSKSISFDGMFSDLDPLKTTTSIFDNNNKITDDPFINLLPLIKSETSKRFPSQKLNDDDIFSDFQAASDVNSRKTMRPTNLDSYKNHTFSNGFTSTSMNSLQQKQFVHSKSISFDSIFSDLDPLHNK
ncbi:6641_t:CDS:2 [Entrophospora sp. SA101]|nr:6641_t:CDS:2 [Entrophospora sp. SA101]CAJ0823013.1 13199_t:CDS:2 [Entrophospora sp. SA101]